MFVLEIALWYMHYVYKIIRLYIYSMLKIKKPNES